MTVVVALVCVDGVVLASDSQGTETDNTRRRVQKTHQLTDSVVWGASGSGGISREIRETFVANADAIAKSSDLARSIVTLVKPILEAHYAVFINCPNTRPTTPATALLAAGFTVAGGPWLFELSPNCQMTDYTEHGFHAIGSGSGFAQMAGGLLTHFDHSGKPVEYGKLIAWRTINAVIQTSAEGVGEPIQMWTVTSDGAAELTDDELSEIENLVGGWQQIEVESLEQLMGAQPAPDDADAPMPGQFDDSD